MTDESDAPGGPSPRDEDDAGWAAPHLPPSDPDPTEAGPVPPGAPPPLGPPAAPPPPPPGPPGTPPGAYPPGVQPPGLQAPGEPPPAGRFTYQPAPPAFPPVQPPYPTQASAWVPPEPSTTRRRRRRKWPWILGGAFAGLIALFVVGIVLWINIVKPPLDAANDYMDAIDDRAFNEAFAMLCAADQASGSPEQLTSVRADLEGFGMDDWEITPFDVNRDGDEATVDVDLDSEDSDSTYVTLNMVKEDGEWRPCGGIFGFEPEDSTSVLDLDDNI